mmetsp:Transcript_32930/g.23796  ORF Transcript_32930/g.23796 Transcript_32930/m.23796 type:complete len:184 (+) Transcript_32930:68-619(+)|eukprot:CAMPEP_0116873196 /NCGR_PEP_ID=MMETSP0463-20121206/4209_1 /TAXON_ID=181622 /ORGANISM="Strombidinopsis sp, Strain SopsisLIS2011" /LENGTH=183 /DNA_ID=CAMNT_0004514701 /DNA_START=50 /DNA_END=601 /DNA_ORIENTATION=+
MSTEEPKIQEVNKDEQEEEMPELENQDGQGPKLNRGEKKCRKALLKLGMKQVAGITRVTLKKRDGLIFVINEPEVLKSTTNESSYAVFGELKLDDPNLRSMQQSEAQKFAQKETAQAQASAAATKKDDSKASADNEAALSEEGLTPNHITMVMEHASCTRNEAIKALRETNDDMINAVMTLTK